jgi:WD40 repeat protein
MAISRTDMTVDLFAQGKYSRTFDLSSSDEKVKPTQRIRGIAFGRRGDRLFVAGADQVRCIGLAASSPNWVVVPPRSFGFLVSSPMALSVSGTDNVAATFDNGSFGVWSPEGDRVLLRRDSNSPRCIDFAHNDEIVIGTDGFSLCSWDARSGERLLRKLLDERAYFSTCWSLDGLVAVRSLSSVCMMDMWEGLVLWRRNVGVGLPLLVFHLESGRLAIPEEHGVAVVDSSGDEIGWSRLPGGAVTAVAFHPVIGDVVVGKADGEIEVVSI